MMKAINKPPSSAADLKPDKKDKHARAEKKKFKLNAERETTIIAGEKSNTNVPSSAEPVVESEIAAEVKQSNPVKVEAEEVVDPPKLTDDDQSSSSGASSIGFTDNTARVRGTQKALYALKQLNSSDSDDDKTAPNATESSTIDLAQSTMIVSDNKNDNTDSDAHSKRDDQSEILDTDHQLDEDKSGNEEVHDRKRSKKSKKKSKKRKKSKKSRKGKKKHSKSHRKQLETSSDSCSSDSTESDSDSSSDSSVVKTKHRKRYDSSTSSSDSSSQSSSDNHKRKRIKKTIVKRNVEVFDGVNYLWKEDDPGVAQLHPNYRVYVKSDELSSTLASAKSCTMFIRNMVDKIYTEEAIMNCTPQGFPARSRGKKYLKKASTKCRLHPDGREALLARATELENERKSWRPKVGINSMKQAFSGRCSELRASLI